MKQLTILYIMINSYYYYFVFCSCQYAEMYNRNYILAYKHVSFSSALLYSSQALSPLITRWHS